MNLIVDLQLHSKYSRAVSKDMTIPGIFSWAKKKGIDLVATGDWTHPLWMKEIENNLEELGNGFLRVRTDSSELKDTFPLFLLATEVSCIYTQGGKGRRIHILIWVPSLESARKINKEMTRQGCNLMSDGRPIIGLTSIQLAELVFTVEPKAIIIPAHVWTPWFGAYGSMSGFDSIEEAFGSYADKIYAVETGLSSNPAMNWQITELDTRSIVSFSDAHSGPKLGREATVLMFSGKSVSQFSYEHLYEAISNPAKRASKVSGRQLRTEATVEIPVACSIAYTIEFYPEEGKYHFTGHRACNIRWGPEDTRKNGTTCPVCGRPLTQGVLQRVTELAGRTKENLDIAIKLQSVNAAMALKESKKSGVYVTMMYSRAFPDRPPFVMLVPLQEIIAECIGSPVQSKKTVRIYDHLIEKFGNEFAILLSIRTEDTINIAGERIGRGIEKVRKGDIVIDPGYDGVFGIVKLWKEGEKPSIDATKEQMNLF